METPFFEFTSSSFDKHIKEELNQNILFSAPFGAGKTTFLDHFFKDNNKDFVIVKLKPINYSVSSNKDIFELIKFDIVFELLSKYQDQIDLEFFKPSISEALLPFLKSDFKGLNILTSILQLESKIGKPLAKLITEIYKTHQEFNNFLEKTTKDDAEILFDYLKSIADKEGTAYENDNLTQLIYGLINELKGKTDKKTVLLIDDLDRLDPEHIFRLFNVFSVHNQSYGEIDQKNKFGFDKIVFVCDLENIRKIYQHKYGSEVDFKGYINKFYSTEPFEFDVRAIIRENIEDIQKFLFSNLNEQYFDYFKKYDAFNLSLRAILIDLINEHKLHLRDLMHIQPIEVSVHHSDSGEDLPNKIKYSPTRLLFRILKTFYGSWDKMESVLNYMSENHPRNIISGKDVPHEGDKRISADILGISYYNEICSKAKAKELYEFKVLNTTFQILGEVERMKDVRRMDFLTVIKIFALNVMKDEFSDELEIYPQLYRSYLKMKANRLL